MSPTALTVTAPASPESPERRRCWECLRRRLVCDAIKPVCNKCRTAGIVCPGYDDKKPLTWLAPGKVTCRTRRKPRSGETDADSKKPIRPKSKTLRKGLGRTLSEEEQRIFDGVEYILHSDLRTDICDVYEAVQYYNAVFYPYTRAGHSGNANVFIDQIPLKVVKYLPTSIAHNLVAIVFQHRLHVQMEWKFDCPSAKHAQARLHHHRGISIRALNEDIANAKTQSSDTVLTGVTLLMQSEITSCISPNWKHHATGFLAMLACRGGATGWLKSAGYLRGVLLSFLITMVVANTTSPSFDQVEICSHKELIAMTEELYPLGLHPSIPCPMTLFLEIIRINHLRYQFSKGLISKEEAEVSADKIISRIMDFNSEDCTGFYEAKEQRDLITHMFHSAVAVFGISSLQSTGVLPNTRYLKSLKTGHSDRLYCLLEEMRKHTVLKKSVQWPLIVAGVEAGIRVDKRRLVGELLVDQGKDIGTPLSFHAKTILRKFWDGTNTDWDVCFDQPYALVA
ncbi:Putative zn(2)Cys(6) fungal-type DNA-binding domain, fungal transcription factor [Colletotrichum destructivum]|uniref:Zn(2)Cys(6) fungal-type DNA-binding domain, fungal transcription factor n=1 Tax=Colletotrichum destructivum TaxID=34406 RepID=A0AAX4I6Z6_9PEZI|nr:Putative zn(2)Cys(6) fungal-type DNA-binding domain, fungal transcription factor [Colletotrichum destructivum]